MISFIVPVYNAEKYIVKCLESILKQTKEFEHEVIVVDDGSQDNTKEVVAALAERNPCIKYFYKKNGGVSSARNYGIQLSKGSHIAFLDADDYLVEDCFKYIKEYEMYDFTVYGYYYKTSKALNPVLNIKGQEQYYDIAEAFKDLYESNLFNSVWNKIYKKEYISVFFDEKLVMGEDLVFSINYLKNVKNVRVINEPLYYYFVNDASVTQKYNDKYICDFIRTRVELIELKQYLGISTFARIDKNFLENVVGTIRLLVHNKDYKYSMWEMKNIHKKLEAIDITEKSENRFSNVIYDLFKTKKFFWVYIIMKAKLIIKKICQGSGVS